jgi:hypothetical protein
VERLSFTNMGDQLNVSIVPPAMAVKAAWPLEVRIAEKSKLLRMNKETLCDFARINGHVRDGCNFETTVEWLLDCGFS